MKKNGLLGFLLILQLSAFAQDEPKSKFTTAIEDNSYYIEEAYNQEDRVVQHISNATLKTTDPKFFNYSFTQEWPFFSQKHQLSYTVGFLFLESNKINGFTDILINYRYQLTSHDAFITLAPRVSLIIPTGDFKKGLGNGVWGVQFNLPASKRLSNSFALHANVGYTILPNAEKTASDGSIYKSNSWSSNMGASLIWLTSANFNIMFEALHNIWGYKDFDNKMITENNTILSPGFRFAINIKNLQIVPGLAVPITLEKSAHDMGIFFYLSFEHPF